MSSADIDEILKLPIEERLRLVELIWESIAATPSAVPLGDAHRAVIDERLAEHAALRRTCLPGRKYWPKHGGAETAAARLSPSGWTRSGSRIRLV